MRTKIYQFLNGWKEKFMANVLTVFSDKFFCDDYIFSNLIDTEIEDINILYIDFDDLTTLVDIISDLSGKAVLFTGPGTFGLERAQFFQTLSKNKSLTPFIPSWFSGKKIGKWSWVSKDCKISQSASIGAMCFIGNNVNISANVTIGNFSWINEFTSLGIAAKVHKNTIIHHNVLVGSNCSVGPYAELRKNFFTSEVADSFIDCDVFDARAHIISRL
jgi:hypothetical protein